MLEGDSPLVSICCVTYNHEKYVRECMDGFLAQKTNFEFEIVVGEDCSTDSTKEILEGYAQLNKNIKIVSSKNNVGMTNNFARVIKRASGKYLAFCEGDDYWIDERKLQKQVDFMEENPEFVLCGHKVKVLDNRIESFLNEYGKFNYTGEISIDQITNEPLFHIASSLFKRTVFDEGVPEYILNAPAIDYYLQLLAVEKGKIYNFLDPMAVYRRYSEGSWSEKMLDVESRLVFFERHIETLKQFQCQTDQYFHLHLYNVIDQYEEVMRNIKENHPKYLCPENYIDINEIEYLRKLDQIYIFGAGGRGAILKQLLDQNNINIKGFIDNKKMGSKLQDLDIFSLSMIDKTSVILVASDWYKDIISQLKKEKYLKYYVFWE